MTPAASWLTILAVVVGFPLLGWLVLSWIDRLLDWRWEHKWLR